MYTNQLVCWHLINMGSPKDFHSVHFHGQTFLHKKTTSYRQAVYPLLPGEYSDVCKIRITSFAALSSLIEIMLHSILTGDTSKQL